jgi:hypothetical protein
LGIGLTVMVNDCGAPGQPTATHGVTVIVAVTGAFVKLIALKAAIFPLPLAAKPMDVLLFVQLKVEPLMVPVKFIAFVVAPLHKAWLAGCTTLGVGLTVMVNVCGAPGQPAADGVTVIVAITAALVILIAVNVGMLPVPVAAKPIDVLLFVQLKTVPETAPVKATMLVVAPLHKDWFAGCTTFGVGLTVIANDCDMPGQPDADGVTVMVAVTGVVPVFIAVKAGISPLPFAAKPIDVLLFVQLKVEPLTAPEKLIRFVVAPLHKV